MNDLIGKNINGKYRIDSLIRETELGDFYRGTNVATGVPVTVKTLAPAMAIDVRYVDRFLLEARAAAGVSHRNILNSIEVGTDEKGLPFAIYQGIEGDTLDNVIKADGKLAESRAVGLAKQIASALTGAHETKLIHGGLSPNKVIVNTVDGVDEVKIYDFGFRPHARNSMTAVKYLAPEQCAETPVTDQRADVYALGTMLYEMVAGEPPFTGPTPSAVIEKHLNEPPAPLSAYRQDLNAQLEPIILSCIAADPERRYQSAIALEEDLGRLAEETGAELPPETAIAAAAGTPKRNIWQTALIVLVGIAVVSAVLIYTTRTRQTNPTVTAQPDANSSPVQPINPATGAQEEAMLRLGDVGDASLVPNSNSALPGTLPGGDSYNAWANGGVPPAGAPLSSGTNYGSAPPAGSQVPTYIPPPGQRVTIDPNGGSPFMPNDGGVILVPIPTNTEPTAKPTPTPRVPAANVPVKTTPDPKTSANPNTVQPNDTSKPGAKTTSTPAKKAGSTKNTKTKSGPTAEEPPNR